MEKAVILRRRCAPKDLAHSREIGTHEV